MKRLILCLAFAAAVASAPAAIITNIFNSGFANSGIVPDGNLSGWTDTRTLSGNTGLLVENVTVTLNISGGWNGDLYGYLTHSSGTVILLDRVGANISNPYGYANGGFNSVVLDDSAAYTNVQGPGEGTPGSYSSTAALTGTFNSKDGTLATAFDGTSVDGSWTLFLADMSFGDVATVTGWTLTITAVPEPATWAAMIFAGLFGAVQFLRFRARKL